MTVADEHIRYPELEKIIFDYGNSNDLYKNELAIYLIMAKPNNLPSNLVWDTIKRNLEKILSGKSLSLMGSIGTEGDYTPKVLIALSYSLSFYSTEMIKEVYDIMNKLILYFDNLVQNKEQNDYRNKEIVNNINLCYKIKEQLKDVTGANHYLSVNYEEYSVNKYETAIDVTKHETAIDVTNYYKQAYKIDLLDIDNHRMKSKIDSFQDMLSLCNGQISFINEKLSGIDKTKDRKFNLKSFLIGLSLSVVSLALGIIGLLK